MNAHSTKALDTEMQRHDKAYLATGKFSGCQLCHQCRNKI